MSSTLCDICDKDARYAAAKAENAKLRELVRDLWAEMHCPAEVCPSCAFNVDDECVFETRIRKLGIKGIEVK